jgi:hypothetical protein
MSTATNLKLTEQEYLLIEQDKCEVEVFRRNENLASTYYVLGDNITLDSIDVTLSVEEVYDRIENRDIDLFNAASKT